MQKKKLHRLEDQLRSVDKDIKEFKEIFSEFGQENKDIAIAGILSIQYGNTCEMLYAGMDERFKKFMPQFEPLITKVTRFLGTGFYRNFSYQAIPAVPAVLFYF